jgi:hypothetical protein
VQPCSTASMFLPMQERLLVYKCTVLHWAASTTVEVEKVVEPMVEAFRFRCLAPECESLPKLATNSFPACPAESLHFVVGAASPFLPSVSTRVADIAEMVLATTRSRSCQLTLIAGEVTSSNLLGLAASRRMQAANSVDVGC